LLLLLAVCDPVEEAASPLFPSAAIWLGAMVPKRWAKRAVTRNTIKRQIYSCERRVRAFMLRTARTSCACARRLTASQFVSATSDALKAAVRQELLNLFINRWRSLPLAGQPCLIQAYRLLIV